MALLKIVLLFIGIVSLILKIATTQNVVCQYGNQSESLIYDVDGCSNFTCAINAVHFDLRNCQNNQNIRLIRTISDQLSDVDKAIRFCLANQNITIPTNTTHTNLNVLYKNIASIGLVLWILNLKTKVIFVGITDYRKIGENIISKSILYKTYTVIENNHDIQQEITTVSKSFHVSEMDEISIKHMAGVTITAGAEFSIFGSGVSFEIGGEYSYTNTHTKRKINGENLEVASQNVKIPPKSKTQIIYSVEEEKQIEHYLADFEIDSNSKYGHQGEPLNRPLYHLLDRCNIQNQSGSPVSIRLDKQNGRFIMKNFPIKRTIKSYKTFHRFDPIQKI